MALLTVDWLGGVLLPKILRWAAESSSDREAHPEHGMGQCVVPLDRYFVLYQQLKDKYGKTLVKVRD